jgi:hypothetical protein
MNVEYEHITTAAHVEIYEASNAIFQGLLREVRELSKKKPEATMSSGKVKIINRVLKDLLIFLKEELEGKYLDELDDTSLPQVSDAVLVMVQFETALEKFVNRHYLYVRTYDRQMWITNELVAELKQLPDDDDEEQNDEEENE